MAFGGTYERRSCAFKNIISSHKRVCISTNKWRATNIIVHARTVGWLPLYSSFVKWRKFNNKLLPFCVLHKTNGKLAEIITCVPTCVLLRHFFSHHTKRCEFVNFSTSDYNNNENKKFVLEK